MPTPSKSVNPNDLLDLQRRHIAQAQNSLARRQRRIVEKALADLKLQLARVQAGTWTEAEAQATRVMLGQAMKQMVGSQTGDLSESLVEVMRMSSKDAAKFLSTMDKKYLGAVRPLRFDNLEWFENTHPKLGKVRLRQYGRSFQRYGAGTVSKIEDAISKRILLGEGWDKARKEVWDATRDVVGDRRWMVDRILRTETAAAYSGMTMAALVEEDTDDEPMLKKLMATFDAVTAPDSVFVHGQTRKLDKPFNDGKIDYMAPPNRPHDREIVVGWRKSWGDDKEMADFDKATAKPRDGTSMAPKPRLKPETPPAPPKEPSRRGPTIQHQLDRTRVGIATTGTEIKTAIASRIVIPRGATLPPVQATQVQLHNGQVNAKTESLRRELREMRARRKRLEEELARQNAATAAAKRELEAMQERVRKAKKAKDRELQDLQARRDQLKKELAAQKPKVAPARLEAPKPISKVGGPGKAKGPAKPKLVEEIPPGDLKPGQWLDLNGGFAEVESVRVKGKFAFVRIKLPGRKVTLPIPQENLIDAWDKRPKPSWVRGTGLDEADNLSRWAVDADQQFAAAVKRAGAWEGASMKEIRALSRFNEEVAEEMVDLLVKAKLDNTVTLRGQQKLSKALTGKGSEAKKLKQYMEEHGLARTAKMSGMEEGMATEIAAEFESMRDGLRFAPKTIDDFSIVSKKRGRANAWVEWRANPKTGDVSRFEMGVNSAQFKTRAHARAQWEVSAAEVAKGEKPFSIAGRFNKDQKVLSTIRHEYGHLVDLELQRLGQGGSGDALLSRGILRLWKKRVKMLGDDMINVSRYASTKPELEGLAESFALAISGKWEHIPELLHQPLRLLIQAK